MKILRSISILLFLNFFSLSVLSDSFEHLNYNNHGIVGIVNMPSARFHNESIHGFTIYNGDPVKKITLSSNPYDWLEASFFYTQINDKPYCNQPFDEVCQQDYVDKGFNFKLRLLEEGIWPAIAIGINDIAGTGYFSSEYIVGSYGIENLDIHFGLGWGEMNGSEFRFSNPLGYLNQSFKDRPDGHLKEGGQFTPSRYFSGSKVSPFYGLTYVFNNRLNLNIEHDTTLTPGKVEYLPSKSKFSYGLNFSINKNLSMGLFFERGDYFSAKFEYKNNPRKSVEEYKYKKAETKDSDNSYQKLIKNLENNGIGVNKIMETTNSIGLELTQFIHPDIGLIEQIIKSSTLDSGIEKEVKTDIKIADLKAISEIDNEFERSAKMIYQRNPKQAINTKTGIKFRPFLASREDFFKGSILIENDTEIILKDNFFFNSNLKYSIADNLDDLKYPPVNTYPAQVRSDVKDYLKNIDEGILIGRAQFDYHLTPEKDHHLMFTAGILEDMYIGFGMEYLYFKPKTNYAVGFEVFSVKKRDYEWRFGTQDYENVTSFINYYYRNYKNIPFDMKISVGEYLAGDFGSTIELSRSFRNGTKFGIFASFTDVTTEQFGEGSFDKGIFFNIPVYGNFINYTWKPLTKDPGARLNRRHSLHSLLVKFRPIN